MRISIITINYNNKSGLEVTIKSVLKQTYEALEYIVIDGGSGDGSETIIEAHKPSFSYAISERDEGIYDAMNKGIDQATGDYLLFLNSGDYLVDKHVISKFVNFKPTDDIVFGNSLLKTGNTFKTEIKAGIRGVARALSHSINHQAIFFKKALFDNNLRYDCSYEIIADWVFTTNALVLNNKTSAHIDLIISCYDTEGISSDKTKRVKERLRYLESNYEPHFVTLLNEYQQLNLVYNNLKAKPFVKLFLKMKKLIRSLKIKTL